MKRGPYFKPKISPSEIFRQRTPFSHLPPQLIVRFISFFHLLNEIFSKKFFICHLFRVFGLASPNTTKYEKRSIDIATLRKASNTVCVQLSIDQTAENDKFIRRIIDTKGK